MPARSILLAPSFRLRVTKTSALKHASRIFRRMSGVLRSGASHFFLAVRALKPRMTKDDESHGDADGDGDAEDGTEHGACWHENHHDHDRHGEPKEPNAGGHEHDPLESHNDDTTVKMFIAMAMRSSEAIGCRTVKITWTQ